jgi:hypothetical protein
VWSTPFGAANLPTHWVQSISDIDVELRNRDVFGVTASAHEVYEGDLGAIVGVRNFFGKFASNSNRRMLSGITEAAREVPHFSITSKRKQHFASWIEEDGHTPMGWSAASVGHDHSPTNGGNVNKVGSLHPRTLLSIGLAPAEPEGGP